MNGNELLISLTKTNDEGIHNNLYLSAHYQWSESPIALLWLIEKNGCTLWRTFMWWITTMWIFNSHFFKFFSYDKKANEVQMLQNKLAQLKAQIEKLTSDLMKSHDDRDKLARDNSVILHKVISWWIMHEKWKWFYVIFLIYFN